MDSPSDGVEPSAKGSRLFTTTHWSVVLAAGQEDSPRAAEALQTLCRAYWYPLYLYVRRRGYGPEDAQDLTQQFFARFLERRVLSTSPTPPEDGSGPSCSSRSSTSWRMTGSAPTAPNGAEERSSFPWTASLLRRAMPPSSRTR